MQRCRIVNVSDQPVRIHFKYGSDGFNDGQLDFGNAALLVSLDGRLSNTNTKRNIAKSKPTSDSRVVDPAADFNIRKHNYHPHG